MRRGARMGTWLLLSERRSEARNFQIFSWGSADTTSQGALTLPPPRLPLLSPEGQKNA